MASIIGWLIFGGMLLALAVMLGHTIYRAVRSPDEPPWKV